MKDINTLSVLRNLIYDDIFSAFIKSSDDNQNFYSFINKLYNANAESDFIGYVEKIILTDENSVALNLAKEKSPSDYTKKAFINDLDTIFNYVKKVSPQGYYNMGKPSYPFDENFNAEKTYENLVDYYKRNGYGKFILNKAFEFINGELIPVLNVTEIKLKDLKDYESEKAIICQNIESFLSGLPYEHMLLYGDRGTGKSSTVHAVLNEYFNQRLRLIEITKENILFLPKLRQIIANIPLKFVIFIDDFSLSEYDDKVSSLKTALEGSVALNASNTMIVATSNRRHIVKESFSDRENSVHARDSIEEQLSLSDRFGITVMFSTTGKEEYLSIVKQLAKDVKLKVDEAELFNLAERWALIKGGRSPRRAKQFIDVAYSCEKKNVKIDF